MLWGAGGPSPGVPGTRYRGHQSGNRGTSFAPGMLCQDMFPMGCGRGGAVPWGTDVRGSGEGREMGAQE